MTPQEVKILLVDDKPERLLSYEVALDVLGHTLIRAQSGTEALQRLMEMEFAAILLDVSMPEMDGFETAELIRSHPRFEETPIIFVTGLHISDLDYRKGYSMGAVDYVQIPVIPEILRGKIQALVQLYLQRTEMFRLNQELALANALLAKAHEELKVNNMRELHKLNITLEKANAELSETNQRLISEILEREKAEQALSQAMRRKDEYIAILAHELRNPLSAIHNAVMVLQIPSASAKQKIWAQELLQRQVKHLTCIMDDLLDVSRISNGRIQLHKEVVELSQVVKHAADSLGPLLKKHQHTLRLALPKSALYADIDTVRLTQVLGNLLTNACKYMDDGGIIELSLKKENGCAVISVLDHGVGIPEDLHTKVFELFVQAPSALNRAQGGLGIGLALVKALVDLHGGRISVKNVTKGSGAEFSVHLPLSQQKPRLCTEQPLTPEDHLNMRLLIIDDNTDSAVGLSQCLENQGYQLHMAHTGESGLIAAQQYQPDVVLLDIGLPDIDGCEVARRMRCLSELADVHIIAMTGYSGEAERTRAQQAGFNHYLVKPVELGKLVGLLKRLQYDAHVA